MKKLNLKKFEFPNIYRFITEKKLNFAKLHRGLAFLNSSISLKWQPKFTKSASKETKNLFKIIIVVSLMVAVLTIGLDLYLNYKKNNELVSSKNDMMSQIKIWESIIDKYPGYKDAYFRLSVMEYRMGDFAKAKQYVQKALVLDPNFKDAERLSVILDSK